MRRIIGLWIGILGVSVLGCALDNVDKAVYTCINREVVVDDYISFRYQDDVPANVDLCPVEYKNCLEKSENNIGRKACSRCPKGEVWNKTHHVCEEFNDNVSCLNIPSLCSATQKCGNDGVCVAKTCLDDANICSSQEKCTDDGVCVDKTCLDDASICKEDEKCRYDGVCVDMNYCEVQSHRISCENGLAWVCKGNKLNKEACADGKECKEGQGCVDKHLDGECFMNEDCASMGLDYICNAMRQCEKKSSTPKDPCAVVECVSGTCDRGICVTDDMKARKAGESCDAETFQSFCNGDKTMECTPSGIIVSDDCIGDNIGKCTVVEDFYKKKAFCSGNEDMLARCAANEASDSPDALILCYGNQDWAAKVICVTDVAGRPAVYPHRIALDCEGKTCGYGNDGQPVCEN